MKIFSSVFKELGSQEVGEDCKVKSLILLNTAAGALRTRATVESLRRGVELRTKCLTETVFLRHLPVVLRINRNTSRI